VTGALVDLLLARARKGIELGLEPTRRALAALGDPHEELAVAHVTGSNGKGSVCAMVESIARHAGLRTGLYTSPHLCRFNERIALEGVAIDDALFAEALGAVAAVDVPLTFFESLTVAAFYAFREARVDLAVVEVGLGGRLDATNVVEAPLVTAITSVALEHTSLLGNTLGAIAREKAGIVKRGAPVVLGPLDPEAERIVQRVALERGAPLHPRREPGQLSLGLHGPHQADNASVAIGVTEVLAARWPAITAAIAPGLANTRWPGRFERLEVTAQSGSATVLLDGAHNPHGMRALVRALGELDHPRDRTLLVFGALADKPYAEMLAMLEPLASRRIYTQPKGREAADLGALDAIAPGERCPDPCVAVERARLLAADGDLVVVTGSTYLIGEVRGHLLGLACDPVIAL
jgi:dihydrofolate synthase/folylpolyglutamate synthase